MGAFTARCTTPVRGPDRVVSDAFDHWEQPAAWPNGLVVQDSVSCTLTAFSQRAKAVSVYHSTSAPQCCPPGGSAKRGRADGLWVSHWRVELEPGAMAAYWQPRSGGRRCKCCLVMGRWNLHLNGRAGQEGLQRLPKWASNRRRVSLYFLSRRRGCGWLRRPASMRQRLEPIPPPRPNCLTHWPGWRSRLG